jgi:hypothetical protein
MLQKKGNRQNNNRKAQYSKMEGEGGNRVGKATTMVVATQQAIE